MTAVARVGWLRSFFAVFVAGSIVGTGASVAAESFGWRAAVTAESMTWGWPYPVDGLWSLTANLTPALVYGLLFAWFASIVAGLGALRAPVVLTSAVLALVGRGVPAEVMLLLGLPSTIALVVVTLVAGTVSYDRLHALMAGPAQTITDDDGRVYVTVPLDAVGDRNVNVWSVRVPDLPNARVGVLNLLGEPDPSVEGVGIHADEPVTFTLSAVRCQGALSVDRLDVDMTVDGRKLHQVVGLDSDVEVPCSA